ncbi:hypothetical protein [Streptobacillus moniliformis]|uniref:hypothetical protein n=1 Tax=Streptobacillus moniliformis TaxID=34105 RepID=UPI0007E4BAD6|nr:hypothetical protein [Streptobacillus moniliformis]
MKLKYRIFNKKNKQYEDDLFLSQDGRYLTKAEWITTIPLTEDYQVEYGTEYNGNTFYENDIVRYGHDNLIGKVYLDESGFGVGEDLLQDLYKPMVVGNAYFNQLSDEEDEENEDSEDDEYVKICNNEGLCWWA